MTTPLLPVPIFRAFDAANLPLAGGKLYTYQANSLIPQATYSDAAGVVANTNPVVLDTTGSATVRLINNAAYKFVLTDSLGTTQWTEDYYLGQYLDQTTFNTMLAAGLTVTLVAAVLYPQTAAEASAGVTPTNYAYPATGPIDVRRYGYAADNSTGSASSNVTALNNAISVASQTVSGAAGATVLLPTGTAYINTTISLPNRVRIRGQNLSGSIIKATAGFSMPTVNYMFLASNGTTSMFDSILQDLFIDCSSVANLGGVLNYAWQENSGLRSVAILNHLGWGVEFQQGYGGSATCEIEQIQLFPAASASGGIKVNMVGSANFTLHVRDSVIAGVPGSSAATGIEIDTGHLLAHNVHFEAVTDGIKGTGAGGIKASNCTGTGGGGAVTNLIHLTNAFTGTLTADNCKRAGATVLILNDVTSESIGSPDPATYNYPGEYSQTAAKAWCIFNGTTAGTNAPTAGFNVTSVTRNSAGNYSVNLTRSMQSANAAAIAMGNAVTSGTSICTQLSTSAKVNILIDVSGTPTDNGEVKFVLFGI